MGSRLYDGRIERLASEELAAVRRGDWAAATRVAVQKAALKEDVQRIEAGRMRP
ncbi:hypothetical protein BH24ACT19_BH24ACT19_21370 [soil metagenome]